MSRLVRQMNGMSRLVRQMMGVGVMRVARLWRRVGDAFLQRECWPDDDVNCIGQRRDRRRGTGSGSRRVDAARGVHAKLVAAAAGGATGNGRRNHKTEYTTSRQGASAADRNIVVRNSIRIRIGKNLQ